MPTVAASAAELVAGLASTAHLDGDRLVIVDAAAFRDTGIRDLAWTAAFAEDEWVGRVLRVGGMRMRVDLRDPRCVFSAPV